MPASAAARAAAPAQPARSWLAWAGLTAGITPRIQSSVMASVASGWNCTPTCGP